jgi:hypothetical protein
MKYRKISDLLKKAIRLETKPITAPRPVKTPVKIPKDNPFKSPRPMVVPRPKN